MSLSSAPAAASTAIDTARVDAHDGYVPRSAFRRRLRRPLVVLGVLILAAAGIVLVTPEATGVGTMLGASGTVPGGVARVNGVIPLEVDGWLPDTRPGLPSGSAPAGSHRVRIIVELTALDPEGLRYRADQFTITGLGSIESLLLWAEPQSVVVPQGQIVTVTQVFEIPNQAVELILRAGEARFLLGTEHHTG